MAPPESTYLIIGSPVYSSTAKVKEYYLTSNLVKMKRDLIEGINKSLKEIQGKKNKQINR